MENNRKIAPRIPTMDWDACGARSKLGFYSPVFSGGLSSHGSVTLGDCRIDKSEATVIDPEAVDNDDRTAIDNDHEWEGSLGGADQSHFKPDQEQNTTLQLASVSISPRRASPWIVHVPRMEREIKNKMAHVGRAPTDGELAECMGLEGVNGLARLFLLLEDLGGTLCTQHHTGACLTDLPQTPKWLLHSVRFRALRAEIHKVLRMALCDASVEDNLHIAVHYRDEPCRESATLEVFNGHPGERDALLDINVCADDRICREQEPESDKLFQVTTYSTQNGALRKGRLWERFHDSVRSRRSVTSWYWLTTNRPPVRWQRQMDCHLTILST